MQFIIQWADHELSNTEIYADRMAENGANDISFYTTDDQRVAYIPNPQRVLMILTPPSDGKVN